MQIGMSGSVMANRYNYYDLDRPTATLSACADAHDLRLQGERTQESGGTRAQVINDIAKSMNRAPQPRWRAPSPDRGALPEHAQYAANHYGHQPKTSALNKDPAELGRHNLFRRGSERVSHNSVYNPTAARGGARLLTGGRDQEPLREKIPARWCRHESADDCPPRRLRSSPPDRARAGRCEARQKLFENATRSRGRARRHGVDRPLRNLRATGAEGMTSAIPRLKKSGITWTPKTAGRLTSRNPQKGPAGQSHAVRCMPERATAPT